MNKKRSAKPGVISAIIIILVIIGIYFVLNSNNLSFSPSSTTISGFLGDLMGSSIGYNIVLGDTAKPEEIAVAARFAATYGLAEDALKLENIAGNLNKRVFIGQVSEFNGIDYANKIETNDAIIIYDKDKDSLFIYTKNVAILTTSFIDSINPGNSGLNYAGAKLAGNSFSELSLIEGNVVEVTRSFSGMAINVPSRVTLNVKLNYDVTNFTLAEEFPQGYLASSVSPDYLIKRDNIIMWEDSSKLAGEYTYTYDLTPKSASGVFAGKSKGIINNVNYEYQIGGQSSVDVCIENWQCSDWTECTIGNDNISLRTRTCTDTNSCGTLNSRPSENEQYCSPNCSENDDGLNIKIYGTTRYGGVDYVDTCLADQKIIEYACNTSGLTSEIVDCLQCSGGACLQQYTCENGDIRPYVCSMNQQIVNQSVCINHQWVDNPEPEASCPVEIRDIGNQLNYGAGVTYKIVIGREAQASDSIGAVELAGKYRIYETVIDDTINNTYDTQNYNLIVVGGPVVNSIAAKILNVQYPSTLEASTIPFNKSIVSVEKNKGIKLLIAGWQAVHTRNAVRAFIADSNNAKFVGTRIVISGDNLGTYSFD
jgi:hypothetical protein